MYTKSQFQDATHLLVRGYAKILKPSTKLKTKKKRWYAGWESNPRLVLKTRKLLILCNARNAEIAAIAPCSYAAVTRGRGQRSISQIRNPLDCITVSAPST
jgi:hypothetical protein